MNSAEAMDAVIALQARALLEVAEPHWDGCIIEVRQSLGDTSSNDARVARPGPVRALAQAARDLARAYLAAEDRLALLGAESATLDAFRPTLLTALGDLQRGTFGDPHEAVKAAVDWLRSRRGGGSPTYYEALAQRDTVAAERDELCLVLLAERGDPAGAPSGGWTARRGVLPGGAPGAHSSFLWDHPTRGRVARAAGGQGWLWMGYQPGQTAGAPTARETMIQADETADKAAEGGEG